MTIQEKNKIKDICMFVRSLQDKKEPPYDLNSVFKSLNMSMILLSKDMSEDVVFSILRDSTNHYIVGIRECEDKRVEYAYKALVLGFFSLYTIEVGSILKIYKKEVSNLKIPYNIVYFMNELLMPEELFRKESQNCSVLGKMFIEGVADYFKMIPSLVKGWNYQLFIDRQNEGKDVL